MTAEVRDAAVKLAAERGWEVFPLRPKKNISYMTAATSSGRRWGATRDPDAVERHFEKYSRANVGLPTGRDSGFFVLDADTVEGHGVDGLATIRALEEEHGDLPATLTSVSPTGSVHRYYQYPADGRAVRNSTGKLGPGVDVRGDGGMVVAPPSVKRGRAYRWLDPDAEVAEAPSWLLSKVCSEARPEQNNFTDAANRPPVDDAELAAAAAAIPNDGAGGWEGWNRVAMALWRSTSGSELGLALFDEWSRKNKEKYDAFETSERWRILGTSPPDHIGVGTILFMADEAAPGWRKLHAAREAMDVSREEIIGGTEELAAADGDDARAKRGKIQLSDFWSSMTDNQYVYVPTGVMCPGAALDKRFGKIPLVDAEGQPVLDDDGEEKQVAASVWLDQRRSVEQILWSPGEPRIIREKHLVEGGWTKKSGASCYNMYRPPHRYSGGDPEAAGPWLDHVRKVYPGDADHIVSWLAHRAQRPGEKINHSLVMLGRQGIGKDTILEPVKHAVGPWNFSDVSPQDILSPYSGYLQGVVVRINEARDLGDVNRYQFYERTKVMMAAPPDVLRINEKYIRERAVQNCCGVIVTTNGLDSLFLPEDDRRHFVAFSELTSSDYDEGYWTKLWKWYAEGGYGHVVAHLRARDISQFDAKAPPPKTEAFWRIVEAGRSAEMPDVATVLHMLGDPDATTIAEIADRASGVGALSSFYEWVTDRKNRKAHSRIMAESGYVPVRNMHAESGLWRLPGGEKSMIYVRASLPGLERSRAASKHARGSSEGPEGGGEVSGTVTPIRARKPRS